MQGLFFLMSFFPGHYMLVLTDSISQAILPFRFVDVIVFWNVGQANCILKYLEHMMNDHSDSTIF